MLGSLIGSIFGGSAMKKAANKQAKTAKREREAITAAYSPYQQSGYRAAGALDTIFGTSGSNSLGADRDALWAQFLESPIYKSAFTPAMNEASNALARYAASKGSLNSGATVKAIQDRAADLGNRVFGQYASGIQDIRNTGLGAQNTMFGLRGQQTQNLLNAQGQEGAARASQWLGVGSAIDSGINTALGAFGFGMPGSSAMASGAAGAATRTNPLSAYAGKALPWLN